MRKQFAICMTCCLISLVSFGCTNHAEPTNPKVTSPESIVVQTNQQSSNTEVPASKQLQIVAQPDNISVLVNKFNKLPETFNPKDLVFPNIPFLASASTEKRQLRKEAAVQLEKMVKDAKKDHIFLKGVSGYRSYQTQQALFNNYVKRDGYNKARTYSAIPGTSEHETGLSIDMTGKDGTCAAEDCFGKKPEAKWLAEHAQEFGFIIRYPKGKEAITGYKYEPWHIRYVGVAIAKEITQKKITLEEYYEAISIKK
ncbi:M15 family metallopeptidase [Shimazuella sp. AN120528]|uniref:M15 family metallopeptidase n=1 Tax=Shimazuella soli TaxID=1892854 RepID=UPI001F10E58C|nr:M15 family metallopeptidase [Shimazuella soli]MCH5584016.1 M15 family metallopeptidase [Shimazuella soli]